MEVSMPKDRAMSYRPTGWGKRFHGLRVDTTRCSTAPQTFEGKRLMTDNERIIYEAGADALYSALWKMAEESPTKTFTLDANPDEAEEYKTATTVEFTADDIIGEECDG